MSRATPYTPLPWRSKELWPEGDRIVNLEGVTVAKGLKPQDAAYIVRAANAYPDLLSACEAIAALPYTLCQQSRTVEIPRAMHDQLRAAIARATGGAS